MAVRQVTKADYIERHPGIEATAEELKTASDPRLVARFTREYWFSVEYMHWDDTRWYGCVQNHTKAGGWETTSVGEYTADQVYGSLSKARENEYGLNVMPIAYTPLREVSA